MTTAAKNSNAMESSIDESWRLWGTLVVLLVLVIVIGKKASAEGVTLKDTAGYTHPMLALEMNARAADVMFTVWNDETKDSLKTALHWDYVFLFVYPAAVAVSCFIAGGFLHRAGIVPFNYSLIIICLQLIAPVLDAVENYALLKVLSGPIVSPWPELARWCAIGKFSLVLLGIGYALLLGGGVWLLVNTSRMWSR